MWGEQKEESGFHGSLLHVWVCVWGDGKGCEHELVLTSLQLLSDIQTGSHCHMTEISAPCPIAQRTSYVCCQHKYRPSHSYTHTDTHKDRESERVRGWEQSQKKGNVKTFLGKMIHLMSYWWIMKSSFFAFVCMKQSTVNPAAGFLPGLGVCRTIISSPICSAPICPITLTPNFPKLSQLIIGPLCQEGNQAQCSN